jgi:hypothetical protein
MFACVVVLLARNGHVECEFPVGNGRRSERNERVECSFPAKKSPPREFSVVEGYGAQVGKRGVSFRSNPIHRDEDDTRKKKREKIIVRNGITIKQPPPPPPPPQQQRRLSLLSSILAAAAEVLVTVAASFVVLDGCMGIFRPFLVD